MHRVSAYLVALALAAVARPALGQETHLIKLESGPEKGDFHISPAVVTAKSNDVLIFQVVSGAPHGIVFDGASLTTEAHAALNRAMPRRSADLSSPLLTASGKQYRMVLPDLSPGTYPFFCLPHRAYDEKGELRVGK